MPEANAEEIRLKEALEHAAHWRRWGPYLSARQWGTVREDYSPDGAAWDYFPHEHARSRAYRWGEDGIAGICDNHQRLCFAPAFWNGRDPILKERFFGLSGSEGNHGEDVKEYYFYLDNTPTHSYMKCLYKYPQAAYPYARLVSENRRRGKSAPEFELLDSGAFEGDRYFDILVEYAKNAPDDILIRITASNRGPDEAVLHLLPTLWFRNTWSWDPKNPKPGLKAAEGGRIEAAHPALGRRWLYGDPEGRFLFTENETNFKRLFGSDNPSPYVKDAFHRHLVEGEAGAVNPGGTGTKAAVHHVWTLPAGGSRELRLRLTDRPDLAGPLGREFEAVFEARRSEADEFYLKISPHSMPEEQRAVQRQAFAGMLWNKQFYRYVVDEWLNGDPGQPPPPPQRKSGRNSAWVHVYNEDVLSMPDNWEFPWFASWDLAFHLVTLALVDPDNAKSQLLLLTREWYMHPNGQIPAYEWAFDDVNPPVQAWAALRIYKIEKKMKGKADQLFLERVFQKLLLNFTWWVNRKDARGSNIFEGGFLGLDNIGVFDRNAPLPTGEYIEQTDGTSWMGMYSLNLLAIALELAQANPSYEDIASKFFEHFLYISTAINRGSAGEPGLWDEEDGFYYDTLHLPNGAHVPLKVRSIVGLVPLFATQVLEPGLIERLPGFRKRMLWFMENRPDLCRNVASLDRPGVASRKLLSIVGPEHLRRILAKMLDPDEFLSPHGIRSLSKHYEAHPYEIRLDGDVHRVGYEPAESRTGLFGGNSNWRGPVWFPMNFLIIEALQRFHHYLGEDFRVEHPAGSGRDVALWQVATELGRRLTGIFLKDASGRRPLYGGIEKFQSDPHWKDLILFHEYFHGDSGQGLGASHQTGWTGLVAKLIRQCAEHGHR